MTGRVRLVLAAAAACAASAACGESDDVTLPYRVFLTVSPEEVTSEVGVPMTLTAAMSGADAPARPQLRWRSGDSTIVRLDTTTVGASPAEPQRVTVRARQAGATWITVASADGVTFVVRVTARRAP